MNEYILIAENNAEDIRLLVEDAGQELGYYLYVMRISTQEIFKDYLCNNLEILFRKAKKDYGLNPDDFIPIKEN